MKTGRRPKSSDYIPTAEEIARECRRIQAGWTDQERQRRAYQSNGGREGPGIKVCRKGTK